MISQILKTFFSEKKSCITLMRCTNECYYENLTCKEEDRRKRYAQKSVETCLTSYFINNKGLNSLERNYF